MLEAYLLIGIFVAFILFECYNISPGGLIVPGYIAIYILQPHRIIYTILISILTLLVLRLLGRKTYLYGKRKFFTAVFLGVLLNIGINILLPIFNFNQIIPMGLIIPGLISNDMDKQGVLVTVSALLLAGITTKILIMTLLGVGLL